MMITVTITLMKMVMVMKTLTVKKTMMPLTMQGDGSATMSILANAKSKICQERFTKRAMNATAAGNKKVTPGKVRGTLKVKRVMEMKTLQKVMMTDMSWRLRKSTLGSARPYHRKRLALWSSCDALCNVTCWVLPLWRGRPLRHGAVDVPFALLWLVVYIFYDTL